MSEQEAARTVDDVVTASAVGRAVDVLAALLLVLGEGSRRLSIVVERANGRTATAGLSVGVALDVGPTAPRSTCGSLGC
ncbi:hypothetical protein AB0919_27850 [Streptomyces sp. NPDC046994]|uniref:hypothetical protein n=1 Tax=Streptomyces sp. NPDC046994 TaxID=3155735 RepID=UPI003451F84B